MAKIKIVSNPYMKSIQYLRWIETTDDESNSDNSSDFLNSGWQSVDINGPLTSKRLTSAFFPFVLNEILDEIIKAYKTEDNSIDVIFEGAPDEFNDLKALAETEKYKNLISVSYGDQKLANARDILPKVAETFDLMRPLIDEKISEQPEVSSNLSKFSETASNRVPLVVIGNYSGGKSTFINSLIGRDILSSSEQPLTAKIYRIMDLKEEGKARILFQYLGEDIEIVFTDSGYSISKGDSVGELSKQLATVITEYSDMYVAINIYH